MAVTYRALSRLMSYPEAMLQKEAGVCVEAIRGEGLVPDRILASLRRLADYLSGSDLYEVQSAYVDLFDRTRSLSLHLYEHVHGESRERGPAMVGLIELYREHGLEMEVSDLPDYLPVFLEFLSILPDEQAASLIGEAAHVLEAISERLKKRQSPYRSAFGALLSISDKPADQAAVRSLLSLKDDDPNDFEALDKAWAEEPVTFGPDTTQDGCSKAQSMLNQMRGG
ncbi:nitrate reductase molybdenum cofactor assembly chaperone [Parvibaculum sp.]|uniref:nitrate reductase molybdenum cofactor assembly chaperone n=1 Tax=Parvibaculum sp. TaxID=2024848 RepID=UPI001D9E8C70|nr:nitrate reductase molybdenum cofactor assembly chaperone [Parvibaculum sp.]MBX3489928.1 nitrate reductase molybdenum cofactor assembly chaperone [Parvibaculum sp.]MCW5726084.1 nitrate reductase molybdenum cofactor assembly chaperone [Parvibaculum sp.]